MSTPQVVVDARLQQFAPRSGLVLVLCPERSGSTLLATMLGANPAIVAPPELFLLRYPGFDAWRQGKAAALPSLAWLMRRLGQPASADGIDARFRGRPIDEVYRWILDCIGPGGLLLDKTPAYARDPSTLRRAEALSPRYLWLVRHPLGVANSWIERRRARRFGFAGLPGKAAARSLARSSLAVARSLAAHLDERAARAALERWRLVHGNIERFVSSLSAGRVRRISYEGLVADPEGSMRDLSRWLGVSFAPGMLEPWRHLPDALGRGNGDERIRRYARVAGERADSWRGHLDEHLIDPRTRDMMARLGIAQ